VGKCYKATGIGQYATVPPLDLHTYEEGFCISFWFYFDFPGGTQDPRHNSARIFDFGNGMGMDNIVVGRESLSTTIRFSVWQGASESKTSIGDGFLNQQWMHYVWCLKKVGNGSSSLWDIYRNGVARIKGMPLFHPVRRLSTNFIAWSSWSDAFQAGFFLGRIDNFGIYPYVLNSAEALAIYSSTTSNVWHPSWLLNDFDECTCPMLLSSSCS
jgi:hypothetical protein